MSRLHFFARAYAGAGLAVFPLVAKGKEPRIRGGGGVRDATTYLRDIDRWWSEWPDSNIGIALGAPSGLWVLDVDPRNGGDLSLEQLELEHEAIEALEVSTGRGDGGRHLYFRWPEGGVRAGKLPDFPGLDVKGAGGYVVAPPSTHPVGGDYAWTTRPEGGAQFAPAWLLDLVNKKRTTRPRAKGATQAMRPAPAVRNGKAYGDAALSRASRAVRAAAEGERNTVLNGEAFGLRKVIEAGHLTREEVEVELEAAARFAGLEDREIARTLSSSLSGARAPCPAAGRIVVVTGGRAYTNGAEIRMRLEGLRPTVIVTGGSSGVDALAEGWAREQGIAVFVVPARWAEGPSAGPKRNLRMLKTALRLAEATGASLRVQPFPGGRGTEGCVRMARSLKIEVLMEGKGS